MIKVVYNACFGGFGVSDKAIKRMAELGHKGATEALEKPYSFGGKKYYPLRVERHDPLLVQVVEELGDEASDNLARLKIATIDGDRYRIDEYDGNESVQGQDYDPEDWTVVENDS